MGKYRFDVKKIRADFPILGRKVQGKQLIYFDNAATSQKPACVIDAIREFYTNYNANVHRGIHRLSEEATERYEKAREKVAEMIHAGSPEEVVFVRGTTEGINLVAYTFARKLQKGDRILSTVMEHHSNIVPWQLMSEMHGVDLDFVDITDEGYLKMEELKNKIRKGARMVAVTQCSNVLGTINDVRAIAEMAHDSGALCLVDGAQSVPHMPVDVEKLGCDFLVFSGHKMCGPTGIGVLYAKKEHLESLDPFLGGGDMIREVRLTGSRWNDVPYKFEAGTPNIEGAIGLGAACEYLMRIGMDNIREHEKRLIEYSFKKMGDLDILELYGPRDPEKRSGVLAFNLRGVHSHDLASLLDAEGVAIRSGHHCAQPLVTRMGQTSIARASYYIYNMESEIDVLVNSLKKIYRIFGGGIP